MVAGGGDNAAAAIGCGVVRPGTGFVSLGTSGVVFVPSATLRVDPAGALHAFCHAVPGQYHLMGVMLSAAGSLRWLRDAVLCDPGGSCQPLIEAAATVEPGAEGLVFLPYLAGERTPHMDPEARGAWIGLSLAHQRRHLIRAVLEGVAFGLRDALTLIRGLDVRPATLHVVGGGARSALWRQILAATLEVPLQRLAVEEGPAHGAALLAMVGAGIHADVDAAVAAAVRPLGEPEPPDPALAARYARLHEGFARLYPALCAARTG